MNRAVFKFAVASAVALLSLCSKAEVERREMRVPLAPYSPRASAAVVVCVPSLTSSIQGRNEHVEGDRLVPASVVGRVGKTVEAEARQLMRLRFGMKDVQISLGADQNGRLTWGPEYAYDVQSDAAEDFVAIRNGSGKMGMLQSLVANRVTGTAILSMAIGSLPSGAHPYESSTFYACEPERERN